MTVSVLGQLEDNALIPYDRLFTRPSLSIIYRARAIGITAAEVITDREPVPYEFLVLATGSTWEGPLNLPPAKVDAAETVLVQRAQYRSSRSVLIEGGGAVGIGTSNPRLHERLVTLPFHLDRTCRGVARVAATSQNKSHTPRTCLNERRVPRQVPECPTRDALKGRCECYTERFDCG
jgi:hypothetical protein